MTAEDFVDVKLSAAGEKLAAATPEIPTGQSYDGERSEPCMRIAGGNYEYCFLPGKAMRMPLVEFNARLATAVHQGEAIFEIVPPAVDAAIERS
jgi:hypothetical protein